MIASKGSDGFSHVIHFINADLDLGFGSAVSLNLGLNFGSVLVGSGSNHGSESYIGIHLRILC